MRCPSLRLSALRWSHSATESQQNLDRTVTEGVCRFAADAYRCWRAPGSYHIRRDGSRGRTCFSSVAFPTSFGRRGSIATDPQSHRNGYRPSHNDLLIRAPTVLRVKTKRVAKPPRGRSGGGGVQKPMGNATFWQGGCGRLSSGSPQAALKQP